MAWTFYGILIKPADATTLTEVLFEGWYGFRDQAEEALRKYQAKYPTQRPELVASCRAEQDAVETRRLVLH
jgi:hypothetical protein